jgi:hypothetical protein
VAEDLHDNALIDALREQKSGSGVPGVMDAHLPDTGRIEQHSPFGPVGMVPDRPTVSLAPDEIAVVPRWPGGHALVELSGPMCPERTPASWWRRKDPLTCCSMAAICSLNTAITLVRATTEAA